MKLPKINSYEPGALINTKQIKELDKCDRSYYIFNDKDKIKLVKNIESIVRNSMEYRDYIKYLKEVIDMTKCSFFTGIDSKVAKHRVSIEIHHEPFTLYDITMIILEKHLAESEDLNPLYIAEEVMKLHYQNKVGLMPVSVTVHELIHNGKIFIPLQNLYGKYVSFIQEYNEYITNELNQVLKIKLDLSKEISDLSILEKKYTYIEVDGFTVLQRIEPLR